jgi:hypothetical protein
MSIDEAIRRAYVKLGHHRAVAAKLRLPIHYVMFVLGLMSEKLFFEVNGAYRATPGNEWRMI